jgi:hypothetical protein
MPASSVLVNSACFVDMPYRMAGEQPEHFAQYLLQAIARGGNPSTYMMGAPGRIPYSNLAAAGEVQRFFLAHRTVYRDCKPGSTVALVRPSPLRKADPGHAGSVAEFRGIYSSLKEKHIPFDIVGAELVARMWKAGDLSRYSVVVVPGIGDLGMAAGESLDAYVLAGGHVVLTGSGGVASDGSVELSTAPSVMRSAPPKSGMDLWATYVTDSAQPEARSFRYAGEVVPVYGSYASFIWKPKAVPLGNVLPQAPYGPPEKCYGHIPSDEPGASRIEAGRGSVLQIPWAIGQTYHEFGITSVRDCFLRMAGALLHAPIRGQLPEQVELIAARMPDGWAIHLLNQTGARRKSFGPHVPITGASIRVKGGAEARALVAGVAPDCLLDGEDLVIQLPRLELFEVLLVSSRAAAVSTQAR